MIWQWLLASILGFLAVVPLARLSTLSAFRLPTYPQIWLMMTAFCLAVVGITGLVRYWHDSRTNTQRDGKNTISLTSFFPILLQGISFFSILLASTSYGFYHYFAYQDRLINTPITVTAIVQSLQISDTITLSTTATASKNDTSPLIGTGYQRQVWQIVDIKPFADDKSRENNDSEIIQEPAENFSQKLPLTVLATANLNKNPDWLPILNQLQPKQTLTVKLALEPIRELTPVQREDFRQISIGFNEALWLRQRDIQAKAQLLAIYPNNTSDTLAKPPANLRQKIQLAAEQVRWQLRQKMLAFLSSQLSTASGINPSPKTQATAILLSLLTGDSGLLSTETKRLYQMTGISHLLAISGPHVMMLASVLGFLLVAFIKVFLPNLLFRLPAQLLLLWTSVVVSLIYALLVGFELPAQRTVWMLVLVTLSVQWLLSMSGYRVLAWVGLLMIWLDTTAVMQAGFWLSFVAVGLLLKFSQQFSPQAAVLDEANLFQTNSSKIWLGLKQLFLLQVWLFILMMPVVVWFFGKLSLVSIGVNLVAVPFLGLIIVPLDMLAGILSFVPMIGKGLSENLWQLLTLLLTFFHQLLQTISDIGFAKQVYIGLSNTQLILCGMAVGLAIMPTRLLPKLFALPVLLATLAIGYQTKTGVQKPQLIVLDDTRLSINLWVNGDNSWLILADNRFNQDKIEKKLPTADILENKLYPLLAKYHIEKLAGVVSQTPSNATNDLVQQLAITLPVQNYWLAGFNPLEQNFNHNFTAITPQLCQVGKKSLDNQLEAITGWQLDENQLSKPLDDKEQWHTQTCFIQVKSPQQSAILMAGDSDTPMQMSQLLCQASAANLLIVPAMTPISQTWLTTTQPRTIHLINSPYSLPAEESQFAIAGYIEDNQAMPMENHHEQNVAKKIEQVQSVDIGSMVYQF